MHQYLFENIIKCCMEINMLAFRNNIYSLLSLIMLPEVQKYHLTGYVANITFVNLLTLDIIYNDH